MAPAAGNSDDDNKKVTNASLESGSRSANGVTQGLIGGILIASFLPAVASAKEKQPGLSEDEPLQARVTKIKQSLGDPLASGQTSHPVQWYNWNNWPNWGNWNNWPNWGNWLNW
jgi:hypothetical protein